MNKEYEVMFIVKPTVDHEVVVAKYEGVIINNNGKLQKTDVWGKKRLAYEIQDFEEGLYVLISFAGSNDLVCEMDRVMRIDDTLLRHMIIRRA